MTGTSYEIDLGDGVHRQWKGVPSFQYYFVSDDGKVFSVPRSYLSGCGATLTTRGGILTAKLNPKGYFRVRMSRPNERKYEYIHRIVASAFVPNPHDLPHVNHIDGVKTNNSAENLEWVTPKQNTAHMLNLRGRDWFAARVRAGRGY